MYSYRKKNIIMLAMIGAVFLMAVGYALLSTTLNIGGVSDLTGTWGIRITEVTSVATGKAYNISDPVYDDTTIRFNVGVKVPGDKMTFIVTVQNYGNVDSYLESINASASGSEVIIYKIEGIQNQELLKAGASKTFTVSTEFDINAESIPEDLVKDLIVSLNFVQYDGQVLTPSDPVVENSTSLVQAILNNNPPQSDEGIDLFDRYGLYYTNVNTEGNETTYYFSGDVQNNYVEFGDTSSCKYNGSKVAYLDFENEIISISPNESQCLATNVCDMSIFPVVASQLGASYFVGFDETTCKEAFSSMYQEAAEAGDTNFCTYNGANIFYVDATNGSIEWNPNEEQCESPGVCMGTFTGMNEEECAEFVASDFNPTEITCAYDGMIVMYTDTDGQRFPTQEECETMGMCLVNIDVNAAIMSPMISESYCTTIGMMAGIPTKWVTGATYVGEDGYNPYQEITPTYIDENFNPYINDIATYDAGEPITWRITRINEDGSIRLIKNESIGLNAYNLDSHDNTYVGYKYGSSGASTYEKTHSNSSESDVAVTLYLWFISRFLNYEHMLSTDAGFCNDRSVGSDEGAGIGTNFTLYSAGLRLTSENLTPQFKCPQERDLFTVYNSSIGNTALEFPIGLLSADEMLYMGEGMLHYEDAWTMTPLVFVTGENNHAAMATTSAIQFLLNPPEENEPISEQFATDTMHQVYPVVNLTKEAMITKGNGTSSNPYVIKTD